MRLNEIKKLDETYFLTDHGEIEKWLRDVARIATFKISSDGVVDVTGDVNLSNAKLKKLPIKFGKVSGNFNCSYNHELESLKGAPTTVSKNFLCVYNGLISLEGAPSYIGGDFYCSNNNLESLTGCASTKVGGYFDCSNNKLTSLEGAPSEVGANFQCHNNRLKSLIGISDIITKMGGSFKADWSKIKRGGLGLVLIDGCRGLMDTRSQFAKIINRYCGQPDKVFECQNELIEAGFNENAVF